jgi:imidazolonepropionase-like amidohydrolase
MARTARPIDGLLVATLLGLAVLSVRLGTAAAGQPANTSGQLALVGGTIYVSPTEAPIRGGVVFVRDGTIAAVGRAASVRIPRNIQTIDCAGLTITAGLWNSHMHFGETKWTDVGGIPAPELDRQLQDTVTRHGFTSVFDIASMSANTRRLRDRIESGEVAGPRIRSTGEALLAPGAVPPDTFLRALGYMIYPSHEITDAAQATAASRKLLDAGADGIKVHLQRPAPPNPPFPESAIRAAVDQAHRAGKPVFVHPASATDVLVKRSSRP